MLRNESDPVTRRPKDPRLFMRHIPDFLSVVPGEQCAAGGHSAFFNAVDLDNTDPMDTTIPHTSFMVCHAAWQRCRG